MTANGEKIFFFHHVNFRDACIKLMDFDKDTFVSLLKNYKNMTARITNVELLTDVLY